jgi:hypothetical protein
MRPGTLPSAGVILSQFPTSDGYRRFVESYEPADKGIIARFLVDGD